MLSRSYVQECLYQAGCLVQKYSLTVIITIVSLYSICLFGLQYVRIETDIVKLWVSEGGTLNEELNYFSKLQNSIGNKTWSKFDADNFIPEPYDSKLGEIPEDEASSSGYQVLIQTAPPGSNNKNVLKKEVLQEHVDLMMKIVGLKVEMFGLNWTLSDLCFKPGELDITDDSIAQMMKPVLERLIPCVWISPIDCFFEGSKPIGPSPPIDIRDIPLGEFFNIVISDLPRKITWSTINPEVIVKNVFARFNIGTMKNFFERTGVGSGYLNRPCLEPLSPECPKLAPNYFGACANIKILENDSEKKGIKLSDVLQPYIVAKVKDDKISVFEIFSSFVEMDTSSSSLTSNRSKEDICKEYRDPFLRWMAANFQYAANIFPLELMPVYPEYGKIMLSGCQGFARNVMNWPKDMILGGIRDNGKSIEAEALQSVILVASPTEVYRRFKNSEMLKDLSVDLSKLDNAALKRLTHDLSRVSVKTKNGLPVTRNESTKWSPLVAREVLTAWQRRFTESMYKHRLNFLTDGSEYRTVHPLASTSISDMLAEFCDFNYLIISVGYVVMLLYAVYSQVRWDGCCLMSINAATGLAFAGVLVVTFASVAGLGLSTWLGIEFNAATTQIVPFLTLGIGVDNMFLLLHNYPQVPISSRNDEIGILLKETGMSILMTSVNNILSFLTGTMLPIPALRSFCTQSSLLLTFNLIAILTVFPAIISWDLQRKKQGRRDMCCCLTSDEVIDQPSQELPYGFDLSGGILTPAQDLLIVSKNQRHQYQGLVSVAKDENDDEDDEYDDVMPWTLRAFLRNYYIPFLTRPLVKSAVIVISLALFASALIGIQNSTIGLELSDVLPEHTAPAAFLKARDKYFSFYPMFIVLRGENIDFPKQQHLIRSLREDIGRSQFVVRLQNSEPSERYWLGMFTEWLQGLQKKLDDAQVDGLLDDFDDFSKHTTKKTPDLQMAYSLACSYGEHYDCSRAGKIKLIDESGKINADGFYNYLYGWHEYESMFYTVSQASFYPKLHKLKQGEKDRKYRFFVPPAPKPLYSRIPFYLTNLRDTPIIVEMIKEIRAISENYTARGLDNFPNGIAFTFWEQYLDLNKNLMKAIGIISFAVFCVISVLLFNPWAALCIIVILLMMTVELAGFLGMCAIKFNPVSAVSLITAVGIGVEFTAHVVFAFLVAQGTRNERMAESIDRVFVPVIHGALSTLLGIIMLGFSEFEFVFKYFFVVMSALIIIGLINGLALFPVLLSIVGPPCEVQSSTDDDYDSCDAVGGNSGDMLTVPLQRSAALPSSASSNDLVVRTPITTLLGAKNDVRRLAQGVASFSSNATVTRKYRPRRRTKRGDSGDHRISYFVGV